MAAKVQVFQKQVKLQGQGHEVKITVPCKGLATSNTHVQYESPITSGKKVMVKVKVFQKYVKRQGQNHEVKIYGTM